MKLKWSFLFVLCLLVSIAQAQNTTSTFQVEGLLLDSLTKEGEPYATIKITKKSNPTQALKLFVSDMQGKFKEKIPGTGEFIMTISSMGRESIVKDFKVSSSQKSVNFGTILISFANNELGKVEIVAQKPLVKADIDKIEYNVQDDPDSHTNSLLEMLRKVPLVTVDGEDKIQVNGSSNFKVYVNGKPNNMMSKNPTEVLKSMPATSIKHIEVITDPGPKYDAEGVGGILNIVLVGKGLEGYTATLTTFVKNNGMGGGLFGTVKSGKLTVSGRYNRDYDKQPRTYSSSRREMIGEITNSSSNQISESSNKYNGTFQMGNMEASYEIDTLRLVSASFGLWGGNNKTNGDSYLRAFAPAPSSVGTLYEYTTPIHNKSSWYSIDGSIDYQRLFSVKDRMLTFSYKINTNPSTNNNYMVYENKKGYDDLWEEFLSSLRDQHNDGSQNTLEQTFQTDYTTPINKNHTIEAGAKYIIRDNHSENDRYIKDQNDTYQQDLDYSSHYKHVNNILAAYTGYSLKIKKLSAKMGLRYERTMQDVKFLLGRGENFKTNFNNFVPSASIGWKITDMSNIRLNYNMRIYRPGIWSLNPYLDDSNPTFISQGNPNLESEKNHSLGLAYSSFSQKFNINISFGYSFTNNSIQQVTSIRNDNDIPGVQSPVGKEVLYSTYENIGKSKNAGFRGYINWNATPKTRLYVNLNGGYVYIKATENLKNDGWNFFTYGGVQQSLPHDWRVSANLFANSPNVSLQSKGSSNFSYSFSLDKSFFKKRLTVSTFANNIFKKYKQYDRTLSGVNFTQYSSSRYIQQYYGMSISYRFGELKAGVKKARRTINNDDVKSGGNTSNQGKGGE